MSASHDHAPACPVCCGLGDRLAVTLSDQVDGTTYDWQYASDGTCALCDGTGVYACAACGAAPADYAAPLGADGYLCADCHELYQDVGEREEYWSPDEVDYARR